MRSSYLALKEKTHWSLPPYENTEGNRKREISTACEYALPEIMMGISSVSSSIEKNQTYPVMHSFSGTFSDDKDDALMGEVYGSPRIGKPDTSMAFVKKISFEQSMAHMEKYFLGRGQELTEKSRDNVIALYKKCAEFVLSKVLLSQIPSLNSD